MEHLKNKKIAYSIAALTGIVFGYAAYRYFSRSKIVNPALLGGEELLEYNLNEDIKKLGTV